MRRHTHTLIHSYTLTHSHTYLNKQFLFRVVFRLGSPFQERRHILRQLTRVRRRAVLVLYGVVVQQLSHADRAAREVRIEVLSFLQLDAGGWLRVARQQRENVILREQSASTSLFALATASRFFCIPLHRVARA